MSSMSNKSRKSSGQILDDLLLLVARSKRQSYDFLERYGVTVPQSGVLRLLQKSESLPIGTLAEKLLLKTSTISGIIDRLERDGHVTRVRGNADRRVVHVSLTDKGKSLATNLPSTSFDKVRRAIDRLEPQEALVLMETLGRVLSYIKREDESDDSES